MPRTNEEFHVVSERLSDGSVVFNVIGEHRDGELKIGATDKNAAEVIASALNDGAAWITADGVSA